MAPGTLSRALRALGVGEMWWLGQEAGATAWGTRKIFKKALLHPVSSRPLGATTERASEVWRTYGGRLAALLRLHVRGT